MNLLFTILLTASPLLLCGGLLIKNKSLCCFYCGAVFFLLSAFHFYYYFGTTYQWLPSYDMTLDGAIASPGFFYLTKLCSMIFPDYRIATVIWALIISSGLMLYIHKYCYYPAPAAVAAAASGLWLINYINPQLFSGILIAAFAFRYASERRFVRFAAIMLLASCFAAEMLLLIPLYIIFITKPSLFHIPVAAVLAGGLLFFDLSPVFTFATGIESERTGADLFYPVIIVIVCVLGAVTAKITSRRGDYNQTMITVLAASAVLALGSAADARLLPLAAACFFPAALTLVPEIIAVIKSIITLTFREKKRPVLIAFGVIIGLLAAACYSVILFRPETGWIYETWIGVTVQF